MLVFFLIGVFSWWMKAKGKRNFRQVVEKEPTSAKFGKSFRMPMSTDLEMGRSTSMSKHVSRLGTNTSQIRG